MHDPLSVADLVHDELQRQASGYDVSEIEADLGLGTIHDHAHLEVRYQELISGHTWEQALKKIRSRFGHYSWVHSINNACLITAGLLWGSGDFAATVGLTVQGGWDSDSNAATAGAVVGTVLGAARLPAHFISPLQDRTRSAVFGYDNSRISDLAHRTISLAEHGLRGDSSVHASSVA